MVKTKLKLRFYGDPVLRKVASRLRVVTDEERSILEEMQTIMRVHGGIGLAAPQVGIAKQVILIETQGQLMKLVNPRVIERSGSEVMEEGCLSLPCVYVNVKRARMVTVRALNENNEEISICAQDLFARALQHEIDHIRGRLIIDYVSPIKRWQLMRRLRAIQEGK